MNVEKKSAAAEPEGNLKSGFDWDTTLGALFIVLILGGVAMLALNARSAVDVALSERGETATATYVDRYYKERVRSPKKDYFLEYHYVVGGDVYRYSHRVSEDEWFAPEKKETTLCYNPDRPESIEFEAEKCGVGKE